MPHTVEKDILKWPGDKADMRKGFLINDGNGEYLVAYSMTFAPAMHLKQVCLFLTVRKVQLYLIMMHFSGIHCSYYAS